MTKKEARAKCRKLANDKNHWWWSLCWDKTNGYFPAPDMNGVHSSHICYVKKDGVYCYASKENEKKHKLTGNIRKK